MADRRRTPDGFAARHAVLAALASLCLLSPGLAADPPAAGPALVLEGGRLLTMAGAPIENGSLAILGGKIAAVGTSVSAAAGARRLSARGLTVLPGLIDCLSCLYLPQQELAEPQGLAPALRVCDGADPFARYLSQVLAEGVTAVHVVPGNRGLIAGTSGLARVAPVPGSIDWISDCVGLRGQLGRTAGASRSSLDRLGDYTTLRESLLAARDYLLRQQAYVRALARWVRKQQEAKKKNEPFKDKRPDKPAVDPGQETLVRVLKGELPLQIEAHRVVDILGALRLQDEFGPGTGTDAGLRIVLLGCSEGYKVAAEIARRKVPVVVAPVSLSLVAPSRLTYGDHCRENAARLWAAGVPVALGVGGTQGLQSRFVRACAALAAAGGLDRNAALEAVTSRAAAILGVGSRLGTLAPGKDADVVAVAGDPLDVRAPVAFVIQNGRVVYERGAQP